MTASVHLHHPARGQKQLRVLSGLHAGASLHLDPGVYRLMAENGPAPDETAAAPWQPLTFLDWSGPCVTLHLQGQAGTADAHPRAYLEDAGDPSGEAPWDDFDPRHMGGLILCVGGVEALWPSDEALLARVRGTAAFAVAERLAAAPQAARAATVIGTPHARHAAAGIGVGLLLAVSALFGSPGRPHDAQATPRIPMAASDLERTLHEHGLTGLRVQQEEAGLLVTGLLADPAQGAIAQQLLAPVSATALRQQWAVADDVAATIDTALRAPRVRTRHLGEGRFVVEGQADSPERVQASAELLRRDLGPVVRELTVNVTAIRRNQQVTSAVAAGELRYDERRDGTKRFGME